MAWVRSSFRKAWAGAVGCVRTQFRWLKLRYGARYTRVLVATAFVTLFVPVPGISVVGVAAVALVAEAHRGIDLAIRRRTTGVADLFPGNDRMNAGGHAVPTRCDVIVAWGATPDQLAAVGTALWRWCVRGVGRGDIYQYLDNQLLADLIAGRFPAQGQVSEPIDSRGTRVRVWDRTSRDCGATLESLRREIPAAGIVDVLVDGASWRRAA